MTAAPSEISIPVNRPRLPTAERLLPYLREIDATRQYSNFGPLQTRLQRSLADHHGVGAANLALAASGTAALLALIQAIVGGPSERRPLCLCPSYTFVGTAAAIRLARLQPFLLDVDPLSWALNPASLETCPELERAALVLVVAPYGRPPDLDAWQTFTRRTGIPVIVDAAACFDSIDAAAVVRGSIPVAVSLHATKTFSTGEGGLILAADPQLIDRAARALNFGFRDDRSSSGPCFNGKLSEYHAAVGLAELEGWATKRQGFLLAARSYARRAARSGWSHALHVREDHACPYALLMAADQPQAKTIEAELSRAHVGWRHWYGWGLHRQRPSPAAPPPRCPTPTISLAA
ncbi:DegT/DnrJ/EryC1/StrS family aminotransferase [Synechococcus sp. GFB01]|uniref:DegT/DnrJ/EryC1/StrS family aminotransferase n=1 Tax=Synechococcus sp. GFB01 TaxID=1662190 RepID=UPI00069F1510|nr:DegT/DnrJ/EryC1/StrS family aminotransferase [Synechococcus sp. GFB01]